MYASALYYWLQRAITSSSLACPDLRLCPDAAQPFPKKLLLLKYYSEISSNVNKAGTAWHINKAQATASCSSGLGLANHLLIITILLVDCGQCSHGVLCSHV